MKISSERLALTQLLHALVVDYWHDVDTNWGLGYYTEDGVFEGTQNPYVGREKIRQFYKWREDRGARTVVHAVHNFQCLPEGPDKATCHWFLMLYAADGVPPLPSKPPIQISYMTDHHQGSRRQLAGRAPQVRELVRGRYADHQPQAGRQVGTAASGSSANAKTQVRPPSVLRSEALPLSP